MAERLAYLEAVVGADITQFRKGMRDIRNEAGVFSETMRGLAGIGRTLTFAFTVPLVAIGSMAAQSASQFDSAMRNINAIAGLTEGQLRDLADATMEFGKTTRGGVVQSAQSLYTVFSAGLTNTAEAMSTMQIATKTAEAGLADLETTTEAMIGVMLAYGDTSEENAIRTSDSITQMVAIGVGSMGNFASALANVVPSASMLGMSVEELMGDLAFLTQRGQSASKASTNLSQALSSMIKPSKGMQAAFQQLGARDAPELISMFGGVNGAIQALIGVADGSAPALAKMFSNKRGMRAVGQMMTNMEMWKSSLTDFQKDVVGATDRAHEQQMMSFAAGWDLMTSAIQAAGVAIGEHILPMMQPVVDWITAAALGITEMNPQLLKMGVMFMGVAAALPPLIWGFASLATPIGFLITSALGLTTVFGTDLLAGFLEFIGGSERVKTELQELSEIIETLTGFDFMPDTEVGDDWGDLELFEGVMTIDPFENIVIETPTSVGQIFADHYEEKGWGWSDFNRAMVASGWEGGAILPEMNFVFPPGGVNTDSALMTVNTALDNLAEAIDPPPPIIDGWMAGINNSKSISFTVLSDTLKEKFNIVWNTIIGFLDTKGTELVDSIASWFDNASLQPLYDAVQLALKGDFVGAIDTVMPGVGTEVSSLFGDLFGLDAELKIGKAIKGLATSAFNFVVDEFVPNLSGIVGAVAGKVGVILFDLVKAGIKFFTSGKAGDLGTDILTFISTFIQDSVITPFSTGFSDAIAGTEFETGLNTVKTAIEGIFTDLHIGEAWGGVVDMFTGLVSGLEKLAAADWSGVAKLGAITLILGGQLFAAAMGLIGGLGTGLGHVLDTLGGALASFVDAIAAIGRGDLTGGVAAFGDFIWGIGVALIQFPFAVLEGIIGGILSFFNIDFTLPDLAGSIGVWAEDIKTSLEYTPDTITLNTGILDTMLDSSMHGTEGITYTVTDGVIELDFSTFTMIDDPEMAAIMLQNIADQMWMADERLISEGAASTLYAQFMEQFRDVAGIEWMTPIQVPMPEIAFEGQGGYDPSTMVGGDMGSLVTPMAAAVAEQAKDAVEEGLATAAASPEAKAAFGNFVGGIGMSGAMDEEGNVSAAPIITNYLLPLEAEWLRLFGAEGTMAIAYSGHSLSVVTDTGLMTDSMTALSTYVGGEFQGISGKFKTATDPIITQLDLITAAIDRAMFGIATLALLGATSITVEVDLKSWIPLGNPHKEGLWEVPYDEYPASLHRGEMVVPKSEADMLRDGSIPTGLLVGEPSTKHKSTGSSTNYITITGVQDVDGLLRELKRRGIDLNG